MTPEELKQALREPAPSSIEHELQRSREASEQESEPTWDTPSISARELSVFARRLAKATEAQERKTSERQVDVELALERALASLEGDDASVTFAAADELLRAQGGKVSGELRRFIAEDWGPEHPDEAAAWLRQAEELTREEQQDVAQRHQQAAEGAHRKQTEQALQAADQAYADLEKNRDWEQVYPHFEGLVRQAPENFLTSLSQAPEKTMGAVFEAARELDRASRVAEFRNEFREEALGSSMDFELSGEEIPEVEPEPDLDRVRRALASNDGNVQRFKQDLLADDLREREMPETDENTARFKAAIMAAKVGPGDVE